MARRRSMNHWRYMMARYVARLLLALSCLTLLASATASPILLIDASGILTGANNVNVSGRLYDVRFTDGSCVALFHNCTVFQFFNNKDADVAAQALLDQVFVDSAAGTFASRPDLISGCSDPTVCFVLIPNVFNEFYNYAYGSAAVVAFGDSNFTQGLGTFGSPPMDDLVSIVNSTYAVFQASALQAEIPEPGSIALTGLAMAALSLARRRKASAQSVSDGHLRGAGGK